MIIGSQHIGVYCRDLSESLSFYVEKFGFKHLFSTDAMEGDKPLKMAWIRGWGNVVIELIEQEDKSTVDAAFACQNHVALRTDDIEAFAAHLREVGVSIEAGPLDPPLTFDRPLDAEDDDVFRTYGQGGLKLRIMFFRGPGGERYEVLQDNIAAL